MPGSRSMRPLTMLLLPPPEGAATTNRQPDAGGPWVVMVIDARCSFDVLHLLAHLLDEDLELQGDLRHLGVDRLGAQGVGLAVQLLGQEIQALAGAAALRQ